LVEIMHNNLGEVTIITMILMLLLGLLAAPEATTFPHEHEQCFTEFHDQMRLISEKVGINVIRFEPTVPIRSFDKLVKFSICTLGIYSIYWAYLLFKDTNEHFRNQRIVENDFVDKMRRLEKGQ